jgi:hypothetical protein
MHRDRQPTRNICAEVAHLGLQLQAMEIIDEILSGTEPCEADVRSSLTWHVEHNPGQPQRALLMHMLNLRRSDHS